MTRDMKKELKEIDEKYYGSDAILGKNLLTFPNKLNSSRGLMFSSMLDQVACLANPEIPYIFTNYEYIIGKHSSAYNKTQTKLKVIKRINKFENKPDMKYLLLVYDTENKKYDILIKNSGEKLTETYGYKYNTYTLDNVKEGEYIEKGTVLYKSTSFDENMLYGYGRNATTLYTTDPMTIEDALVVSDELASLMSSYEYDIVRISLNDNDILTNLYGNDEVYKSFPDIGESIKDFIIAVKRQIAYSSVPFDLKEENMTKILSTDEPFYVPFGEDTIVDVNIYCNKKMEEIEDHPYNNQINKYLYNEMEYYETIKNVLQPIIDNEKYGDDLAFVYNRVSNILDPEVKWIDNNKSNHKIFNNMIIEFVVEKKIPVCVGQKFCGRYGDKGVISEIRPVEEMPILEDGTRIHMLANILGIVNRLNPGQTYELEINFISNSICNMMKDLNTIKQKERLLFDFISDINPDYGLRVKSWYLKLDKNEKDEFILDAQDNHIYIEQPPMYGNVTFEQLEYIYDKYKIKPMFAYVQVFGKKVRILNPVIAAEKYIIKLKHHPKSKFSARSTGFINSTDQPTKTSTTKQNKSICNMTPIKFGDMETLNLLVNNNPKALEKMNMLYASSPIGRRDISQIYEYGFCDNIKLNKDAKNRNVEIMNVNLKARGVGLKFIKVKKEKLR